MTSLWGQFPSPGAVQRRELRTFLEELDAGRTDSPPVRRWIDAGAPFAYLLRAVALVRSRRHDEAARDVTRAVELAPHSVLVLTVAARIRFVLRDYAAALADLDTAAAVGGDLSGRAAAVALDWKFELARRLGNYIEAIDAVDRALALDPDNGSLNLRRLEQVVDLLGANHEGALRRVQAALAIEPESKEWHMRAAELCCRLNDLDGTRRAVEAAAELSLSDTDVNAATVRVGAARHLIELGALTDALTNLDSALELHPGNAEALSLRGQIALWAGRSADAERIAEQLTETGVSSGWRIRGGLRVLAGDYGQGLADLEEALRRDTTDHEAHVWRGEALYRLGRFDDSFAALNRGGEMFEEYANYLAPQILRLLVLAQRGDFPGLPEEGVPEALDRMFPGEREATDENDVAGFCELLERALLWMRGNRSFTATYVCPDDAAGELVPLRLRPSPRGPSKSALWLIKTEGAEGARRALQRVERNYPTSAEPHCYHGELYLYLGDYVEARSQFEQALTLYAETRWAYIGLGAVELLEGHPDRTLPLLERSVELSRGAGPTLFVYRGEALFRLGRLEEAIADLEYATQLNPTRLGAWVDLALARDKAGEEDALARGLAHVRRVAPGLVHDAAIAAGVEVSAAEDRGAPPERETLRTLFEMILRLMRGNRSSTCVTYFTDQGLLRVVPHVPAIDAEMEGRELQLIRALLERSVGLGKR